MTLLARAHLRQLWRERWQALLAVLGVAVGVAVVVAVDLVNASSREAMHIASAQVSGTATHVLFGPGEQLDETRYAEIRRRWRAREGAFEGVVALAPVVTGRAVLRDALGAPLPVQVLGIDPVSDAAVRDFVSAPGEDGGAFDGARLLTERGTVLLDARSAYRAGLAAEDLATIEIAGVIREIRVLAVLDAVDDALGDGLMLADIATAQELLGRQGWLDRVDLVRGTAGRETAGRDTAGRDTAGRKIANRAWPSIAWLERAFPGLLVRRPEPVTERLPGGLRIEAIAERSEDTRALASSFQLNLAALGLLAIVVGLFLIHGTMRFSVLRRQRQFGALRALGVMPVELGRTVMLEAFVLALIGTAFGLLLGRVLAGGLLGLVSATLQGLYDQVAIGALASDPAPWLKGMLVGVGGTLAVAAPSAAQAAAAAPRDLQLRALTAARGRVPWRAAALFAGLGGLAIVPGSGYLGGLLAIAGVLLAAAALTPACLRMLIGLLARVASRAPLRFRLHLLESARGLARSGVASAALLVAIATSVGMGVMVESFRDGVERWLGARLAAPVYARLPPGVPVAADARALINAHAGAWLERESFRDRIADVPVNLTRVTVHGRWPGALDEVLLAGRWDGEGALVSEPLARTLGLPLDSAGLGDAGIVFDSGQGPIEVPVAGVYREYGGGRGSVNLPAARWPAAAAGAISFEIFEVDDVDALIADLTAALPPGAEVRRNREILEFSLAIFDRTFRVTAVLQTLAGVVAALGLFGALSALAIERRAQFGVMRTLGLDRLTPAVASVGESVLLAGLAALLALPVGVLVAYILLDVVNVRAFGWSLDLALTPWLLLEAFGVALLAGVAAALAPAWRLHGAPPAQLLAHARVV
ncbi:MAG: ABC transporter permease [Pseudomonadota bacterium]|nr:ABC transporter permease [Pseudomonadota bacterium]